MKWSKIKRRKRRRSNLYTSHHVTGRLHKQSCDLQEKHHRDMYSTEKEKENSAHSTSPSLRSGFQMRSEKRREGMQREMLWSARHFFDMESTQGILGVD